MDKSAKEKESKTPPPTSQVYNRLSFVLSILRVNGTVCVTAETSLFFQEQTSTTTSTGPVNPDWASFQVFNEKVFVGTLFSIVVGIRFWFTQLPHCIGIFPYASTWIHGIKSSSSSLYVGCPGNARLLSMSILDVHYGVEYCKWTMYYLFINGHII